MIDLNTDHSPYSYLVRSQYTLVAVAAYLKLKAASKTGETETETEACV